MSHLASIRPTGAAWQAIVYEGGPAGIRAVQVISGSWLFVRRVIALGRLLGFPPPPLGRGPLGDWSAPLGTKLDRSHLVLVRNRDARR